MTFPAFSYYCENSISIFVPELLTFPNLAKQYGVKYNAEQLVDGRAHRNGNDTGNDTGTKTLMLKERLHCTAVQAQYEQHKVSGKMANKAELQTIMNGSIICCLIMKCCGSKVEGSQWEENPTMPAGMLQLW